MTIKLSELKAARAAMTQGDFVIEHDKHDQPNIYTVNGQPMWIAILPHQCVPSIEKEQNDNADGIAATHNAAYALIEIAESALAYTRPVETEQDARDKESARRRLLAALSKVQP